MRSAGSSSRWTDPPDRASRARRAASRPVSACATSTPAPSSARSRPGCSSRASTSRTPTAIADLVGRARAGLRHRPAGPHDHRRRQGRRRRDPVAGGDHPRQRGGVRAGGTPSAAQAAADDHRRGRHRRRGAGHRLGGGPGRRGQGLPDRGPVGARGPSYGGGRRRRRRRDPGRPAAARQDRQRPHRLPADHGRGCHPPRHHAVHPRRGGPAGRGHRRRGGRSQGRLGVGLGDSGSAG